MNASVKTKKMSLIQTPFEKKLLTDLFASAPKVLKEMQTKIPNTQFLVNELLEKNASENERKQGLDLADYITRFNYSAFRKQMKQSVPPLQQSGLRVAASSYAVKITQPIEPENTIKPANRNNFVEFSTRETIRRDYIGDDGILHIYYPGIPELN